jgi:transcriptional regulator GlxA family with amidase domain
MLSYQEEHYSPQDLAKRWKFSARTIQRMFIDYPGVLKEGTGRRVRLRIPASVAERFHRDKTAPRAKVQLRRRRVK